MKANNEKKTPATFAELLRTYEQYASNPTADPAPLTDLATACAYSVLRKCIDVSHNKALENARKDLTADLHNLDRLAYASAHATETRYNAEGDPYTAVIDKDLYEAYEKLLAHSFGDGLDLVHDAVVAILDETQKAKERHGDTLPPCFLEQAYTVRRLNRKVWIKAEDSAKGWQTVTTTPIQEIYKAIRRAIENSRAVQADPRNGYTYLSDLSTDPESDAVDVIYHRYGKYADLGGYATDINGNPDFRGPYTADRETADRVTADVETLIEKLNLTQRQATILDLRMRGYGRRNGYKSIATYLGVSFQAVQNAVYRIQSKCEKIGFTPSMWAEMTSEHKRELIRNEARAELCNNGVYSDFRDSAARRIIDRLADTTIDKFFSDDHDGALDFIAENLS